MKKALSIGVLVALVLPSVLALQIGIDERGPEASTALLNNPPARPTLTGPANGDTGTTYTYTAVTTDPDGDQVFYCFDWGDGTDICTPLHDSGQQAQASHAWDNDGTYTITVKATDQHGAESPPATLTVSMPLEMNEDTHFVLAEMLSTTWCPNCPRAEHAISDLYETGEYPFHFVTLVIDSDPVVNPVAVKRARWLSAAYIPMLYLDGGYKVADNVNAYGAAINEVAQRDVHELEMDINALWAGNAEIAITVSITNRESSTYVGHLRVYVTEIVSRWNDEDGDPIPYALLDFALNKYVSIPAGETYTETATFDGKEDHAGNTYGDIDMENIQIVGSVAHWMPHLQKNPWDMPKPSRFLAQFTDQTAATLVYPSLEGA